MPVVDPTRPDDGARGALRRRSTGPPRTPRSSSAAAPRWWASSPARTGGSWTSPPASRSSSRRSTPVASTAHRGAAASVELAVAVVEPKLTTEEAKKAAPLMTAASRRWTTYYEVERAERLRRRTSPSRPATINGYVVAPGAVFDFWKAIGEVSLRDAGIATAARSSTADSRPTGAIAGGICSCSTTLFNAAARAGLEILDRRQPLLLHRPLPEGPRRDRLEERRLHAEHDASATTRSTRSSSAASPARASSASRSAASRPAAASRSSTGS